MQRRLISEWGVTQPLKQTSNIINTAGHEIFLSTWPNYIQVQH